MLEQLLSPATAPLRRLSLSRLRLERGKGYLADRTGGIKLVYILTGTVDIQLQIVYLRNVGSRFRIDDLPSVAVIPEDIGFGIHAIETPVDALVCTLSGAHIDTPLIIRPNDVREYVIGKDHYRRTVRESIGSDLPCELKCGETINPPGLWSSWPPHAFERKPELAPKFEELFFYFGAEKESWGYQRRDGTFCNGDTVDDIQVVEAGDALAIPLGEHPVTAGPDNKLGYVWFYVSPEAKHYHEQEDGSWLYD